MKSYSTLEEDDGDGLDSLLDTMTNVVGILVMVLIATQLGVKDAVDRIAQSEKGSQVCADARRTIHLQSSSATAVGGTF